MIIKTRKLYAILIIKTFNENNFIMWLNWYDI